jgi:signal peptidase I
MKKRLLTVLAIAGGIIICLYILGRITGGLQFFKAPTSSNEPTIKNGTYFFSSNLITPQRFNFICYHHTDSMFGKQIWVHRLCGLPGDIIQIKNGNLFVNGKPADGQLSLKLDYIIPDTSFQTVVELAHLSDEEQFIPYPPKSAIVALTNKNCETLSAHKIPLKRRIREAQQPDDYIQHIYGHPWNEDNFGPITVPSNHYFVLGDNRYRAQDSRYTGFIPVNDFYGTVLGRE